MNITCSLVDKYSLVNVTLFYAINGSDWQKKDTRIIDGDYYNGTFEGIIPAQSNGAHVAYYIKAEDSIGYKTNTVENAYDVSIDKTPPTIIARDIVQPRGNPILSSQSVTIRAMISDEGSGVKNATLLYSTSPRWEEKFSEVPMKKVEGSRYNCSFTAVIPSQENGTTVIYYIKSFDYESNFIEQQEVRGYTVRGWSGDSFSSSVSFSSIDMQTLTTNVTITITANFQTIEDNMSFNVQVINGVSDDRLADAPLYLTVNASNTDQCFFQKTASWSVHLMGSPNKYPYDQYFLNFTFKIWRSQPSEYNSQAAFTEYTLKNTWNDPPTLYFSNSTTGQYDLPILVNTIILERNDQSTLPLTLLIVTLFSVLGGTLIVEPSKLNERLTVFLAVFIFVAGFYFSLGSFVPYRYGFTIAEGLFLSLVIGSAFFTIGSFVAKSIGTQVRKVRFSNNVLNFTIVNIGLIIDFVAALLVCYVVSGYLSMMPILISLSIISSISYGLLLRIAFKIGRVLIKKHNQTNLTDTYFSEPLGY